MIQNYRTHKLIQRASKRGWVGDIIINLMHFNIADLKKGKFRIGIISLSGNIYIYINSYII